MCIHYAIHSLTFQDVDTPLFISFFDIKPLYYLYDRNSKKFIKKCDSFTTTTLYLTFNC